MHTTQSVRHTVLRLFALIATASLAAGSAQAAFKAEFQAQAFGSTNWSTANPTGWAELDFIPTRVAMTGGPANAQTITVRFDHTKAQGSRLYPGIQNLLSFTPSPNVVITSGPTLSAPVGQDVWSYTFTVNLTNNTPGFVEFRTRLSAGAHNFPGSSLQIMGLGTMSFPKPAATSGNPDLSVVKTGPTSVNAGQTITYSLSYNNALAGSAATGVQIIDILPPEVSFVSATGGGVALGNTVTWDLGDLPRGASGVVTYKVAVTNILTTGFSFHNDADIESSQNDLNISNNFSRVTTVVSSNCIPPSIIVQPSSAASCGELVNFTVAANGSAPLSYQWRKNGADIGGATSETLSTSEAGSYDVVISNLCGDVTSTAATLTVGSPTVLSDPTGATVCAGDSAAFLVDATGAALTYQWRKNGVEIAGATNAFYEIASVTEADAGNYDVVVVADCGSAISGAATLIVNIPPQITAEPVGAILCDGDLTEMSVSATGTGLTYQWRKDGSDIDGATGTTYETDQAGSYDVVVTGTCGQVTSAAATIMVKPLALAADDSFAGDEDASLTGNVLDNDTGGALSAALASEPAHGSLSFDADGSFTYTPSPLFHGTDSFTYRAHNDCGDSNLATVTLEIGHVNHAPVASDDNYGTLEDTALNVSAPGVLANDSDMDGDALQAVLVDGPSHGVVTLNANGSFQYTPLHGFFGTDSFTYRASDTLAESADATVSIEVTHVNHAPVAGDDSLTIAENSGTHLIAVLANDSDVDAGDVLTITAVTQPANGVAEITTGGVNYTPNANFHGEDSFTYTINDGQGGTATGTVSITVEHVVLAPVAQDDLYQVDEDDALDVAAPGVLANDVNPEPTAMTATLVTGPSHGSLTFNANGSFSYVPDDNYNGPDSFTYKVNNGFFDSNIATVRISVLPVLGAGDIDLYVKTASAKLNWAAENRDALSIRGQINPRGINDNLSGATIGVKINNIDVMPVQTLDAKGVAKSVAGTLKVSCRLKAANGAYSIKVTGANLREALGLANQNQAGVTVFTLRLTINDANLDVPITVARLETPFKTAAGKSSSLKFNFRKNRTLSGAFNANKTTGTSSSKGQIIKIRGVLIGENGEPVIPTGNISVHLGGAPVTVPLAELTSWGAGNTSIFQYKTGTMNLVLANSIRVFILSLNSADIGLPAAAAGQGMKHDLPLMITVPTARGTMVFESIIELKRTSESSTHWKR